MKTLRTILFWSHLVAGVIAGIVILIMSATGAALAFKPQIIDYVDRDVRFVEAQPSLRLAPSRWLAAARTVKPDAQATSLVIERDPSAAAAVAFGREATVYVNPYTGAVLGEGSSRVQAFFRTMDNWHRWLGVGNENRALGRAVTAACNLAFLGLAISGIYLWWPRQWSAQHTRPIIAFKRTSTGRARDFNWHNVIGFWSAPVLIVLTATAVVMSYPWANRLLYRMAGSPLPAAAERAAGGNARAAGGNARAAGGQRPGSEQRGAGESRGRGPRDGGEPRRPVPVPENLDLLWARAEQQLPTWGTVTLRLPERPGAPVSFTMNDSQHWNQFARSQLALDAATGEVVRWEPYEGTSRGQKARGWVRFGHTGELGGVPGQFIAGVACVGGVVLVWTGFALAYRRLLGWQLWKRLRAGRAESVRRPASEPATVAARRNTVLE